MISSAVAALALTNQVYGAAVPNRFIKRQEEDGSSSAVPSSTVSEGASSMSSMASGSSAAPSAEATASFADGLVGALYGAGLNSLAGALEPLGDDFASQLEDGNYTIFAPTDEAFGEATLNTSNTDALQEVLTYHILPVSDF